MPDLLYFHFMPLGQVLNLQLLGDMTVRYARPTVFPSNASWTSTNPSATGGYGSQVCQTYFHLMPLGQEPALQLLGDMTVRYARPTVLPSNATWTSANPSATGGYDSQVCQI